MDLTFKPIDDFCNYGINRLGQYSNLKTGKILKPHAHYRSKHLIATLFDSYGLKHEFALHRLVAITFIPNPDYLPFVVHIDGDKSNNHVSNLKWCDKYYVARNRKTTKLSVNDVIKIYELLAMGTKQKDIARQFSITGSVVSRIKTGKIYPYLNKH